MKPIIVGYDESEPSKRALDRAAQLSRLLGSPLIVTSVVPIVTSIGRSVGAVDPVDSPARHQEELDGARRHLESQGLTAEYVEAIGEPADAIAELAEERDAEMIVVGTRGPKLLQRLLGQSVSEAVSHKAHRDVLIVH